MDTNNLRPLRKGPLDRRRKVIVTPFMRRWDDYQDIRDRMVRVERILELGREINRVMKDVQEIRT